MYKQNTELFQIKVNCLLMHTANTTINKFTFLLRKQSQLWLKEKNLKLLFNKSTHSNSKINYLNAYTTASVYVQH